METHHLNITNYKDTGFISVPLSRCAGNGDFRFVLSLRKAGNMSLSGGNGKNRALIMSELGLSASRLVSLRQTHSRKIFEPEDIRDGETEGDGIITDKAGAVPSVTVADCMPIALLEPDKGIMGMLHSGWKGTGILESGLLFCREKYSCEPADITVVLGPHIGPCCYTVQRDRADIFAALWGPESVIVEGNQAKLSLLQANLKIIKKYGVKRIIHIEGCTYCSKEFGSYRREGPESYTRMLALIANFA